MLKLSWIVLLSLILSTASSQNDRKASDQIFELKNGVLLVRLMSRTQSIEALQKAGNPEKAEKVKQEQLEKNKHIIQAFQARFDFCPVYFFYTDQTASVKANDWAKVDFLGSDGTPDSSLSDVSPEVFMMAELGTVEPKVNDGVPVSDQGISGLVVSDREFNQLSAPFPYYVRTYDKLPFAKSIDKAVKDWNALLYDFYDSKQ